MDLCLMPRDDQGDFLPDGLDIIRRRAVDGILMTYEVGQEAAVARLREANIRHVGFMADPERPVCEHWVAGDHDMGPCVDAVAGAGPCS